ncbi:MAG: hypothetical protein L0Y50_06130 [Beijerinckiaceae bacterium]|nr:hypothetical protein [Beijerinckiaceae bacterium]MCI0735838.1 hypothetical protein [Beijerinckiaceae bacterium]
MLADFNDRAEFEAWLKIQPREVLVALAARAALRALPYVRAARNDGYVQSLVMPMFRAAAAQWALAKYPSPETWIAATRAAAAIAGAFADPGVTARLRPFISRQSYFCQDSGCVSEPARAAIDFAVCGNRGAASALRADAAAIESGRTAQDVLARKLWPAARPRRITQLWKELKQDLLDAQQDWKAWTEWYEAWTKGGTAIGALEAARVTISDDIWLKGQESVTRETKALIAGKRPVRRRKEVPTPMPEVPPLRPAALEPAWSQGKLILPPGSAGDGDFIVLAAALKLVRAEILTLADEADRSGSINERSIACLRNVAARIPGYVPAQSEFFYLAHVKGFLEGSSIVIHEEWPAVLSERFAEVTRHFDLTVRQFPKWRDFVSNAEEEQLTSGQIAELPALAGMMAAALREGEAQDLIDPAIPLAVEVFHAPLQGGIEITGQLLTGTMESSKLLLASDLLESLENIAKRTAEAALAIKNSARLHGTAAGAKDAFSPGDGGDAYRWMTSTLLEVVTAAPVEALRSKFCWLEPIVAVIGRS